MQLKFKKMREGSQIPKFGNEDNENAGLDLFLAEGTTLEPGESKWLYTGVGWEPGPLTYEVPVAPAVSHITLFHGWKPALFIRPRSSMADRDLEITEGTVDAGYRGEIRIHVINRGKLYRALKAGDRIAQAVPILVPVVEVVEVEELSPSRRGAAGFGSTGA